MLGTRSVTLMGGIPSNVGYLMDNAGHIAQLPQIYKGIPHFDTFRLIVGFNINSSVVAKGVSANHKSEFWWQSPGKAT
jgi:alpha-mannosidase